MRRGLLIAAMFMAALSLMAGCGAAKAADEGAAQRAVVERVVDGDTVVLTIGGQGGLKTRLISIDAPESVATDESRNCEEGKIASEYLEQLLPAGTEVYVTVEKTDRDKYGRLLRHVWLADPSGRESDEGFARGNMVEAVLVSAGMAQAKKYDPDTAYYEFLKGLGDDAIASDAGVSYKWASG
jgi:micrococcal nuclease